MFELLSKNNSDHSSEIDGTCPNKLVSVGKLTRNWHCHHDGLLFHIKLCHDTITGYRVLLINDEEVPDNTATSSPPFFSSRIAFKISDIFGYVDIDREADYVTDNKITWYYFECKRVSDSFTTRIHRRFRDFADMNSQVKQSLKGHHLRTSLPILPEKQNKLCNDPSFISQRLHQLQNYLNTLITVPHVQEMMCLRIFLGINGNLKEMSYLVKSVTLGLLLQPSTTPGTPVVVANVS
eukprot:gene13193-27906_t